jgi:ribulose-bisphosphate carboxylase large chain
MTLHSQNILNVSGDRFSVTYSLWGEYNEVKEIADAICVEETAEFPEVLIGPGDIRDHILGHVESITKIRSNQYHVRINYAIEITSFELLQFLNVVYGNISMIPNIKVERFDLPDSLLRNFNGPRFGTEGLRKLLGIQSRALLATAIKPMGLSAKEFAQMAYECAIGGMDIVKDDHGLTNQSFAPFRERVEQCSEAIRKANQLTGENCLYFPNISGPIEELVDKAIFAKESGAGGLMVIPSLIGWDMQRYLADHHKLGLPIISHPAFHGSYLTCPNTGFSYFSMYGQLVRMAGGDVTVFPNYLGRFTAPKEGCYEVVLGSKEKMGNIKSIFPSPGGGATLKNIPEMKEFYGNDMVYLMGGGLHHGESLIQSCKDFRYLVESL